MGLASNALTSPFETAAMLILMSKFHLLAKSVIGVHHLNLHFEKNRRLQLPEPCASWAVDA